MGSITYTIKGGNNITFPITVTIIPDPDPPSDQIINSLPHTGTFIGTDPETDYMIIATDSSSPACSAWGEVSPCVDCPEGYTPNGDLCIKEDALVPPTEYLPSLEIVAATDVSYTNFGTLIFDNYFTNGTGTFEVIPPSNEYWINKNPISTSKGPMNRAGVWVTPTYNNQDIRFATCIEVAETKVYYVGVGCDNWASVILNGVTLIDQNRVALAAMLNKDGTPDANRVPHKYWYIYPIELNAGYNTFHT